VRARSSANNTVSFARQGRRSGSATPGCAPGILKLPAQVISVGGVVGQEDGAGADDDIRCLPRTHALPAGARVRRCGSQVRQPGRICVCGNSRRSDVRSPWATSVDLWAGGSAAADGRAHGSWTQAPTSGRLSYRADLVSGCLEHRAPRALSSARAGSHQAPSSDTSTSCWSITASPAASSTGAGESAPVRRFFAGGGGDLTCTIVSFGSYQPPPTGGRYRRTSLRDVLNAA